MRRLTPLSVPKKRPSIPSESVDAVHAPAMAQEAWLEWDTNGYGVLSDEKFTTGFAKTGLYEAWDTDDDGALTENEFTAGAFDV